MAVGAAHSKLAWPCVPVFPLWSVATSCLFSLPLSRLHVKRASVLTPFRSPPSPQPLSPKTTGNRSDGGVTRAVDVSVFLRRHFLKVVLGAVAQRPLRQPPGKGGRRDFVQRKNKWGGGVARVAVANCDWLASFPLRHLEIATVSPPPLLPPRRRGSKFMWGSTSVIAS